jgi:uncharacterized protein
VDPPLSLSEVIETLGLAPHPEGGYFVETFRDASGDAARGHSTAIYFVLRAGEVSRWHRVDAAEVFHHYYGVPVQIRTWRAGESVVERVLGPQLRRGERPQVVIEPSEWQTAHAAGQEGSGEFCILGCTVAPAFEFRGFEMAPLGWEPDAD